MHTLRGWRARRGQMLAMTGSALHSAWTNPHHTPRKAFIISWNDVNCSHGFESSRVEAMREFYPRLRAALPPERRHIVDTEVRHFVSLYEDHWEETYVPTTEQQERGKL